MDDETFYEILHRLAHIPSEVQKLILRRLPADHLAALRLAKPHLFRTPIELPMRFRIVYPPRLMASPGARNDARILPSNESSPFTGRPYDVHRQIFTYLLPHEHKVYVPYTCSPAKENEDRVHDTTQIATEDNQVVKVCDLMVLNKRICAEVASMLYEECTFGVHIYEGIVEGGIEFLNSVSSHFVLVPLIRSPRVDVNLLMIQEYESY